MLCPVFLPACHTTGFAWVPLYDYTTLHICRLVQCITVSYWASVGTVLCAPRFLLCISLYASFFVTCSVSCTFCVYVLCAPSHLSPHIPFLYTVVRHTLSVCRFSTLRQFGRFASDYIDSIGTCLEGLLFTSLRLHLPSFSWRTPASANCLDRASVGSFLHVFYKAVPSCPAHRRLRRGNYRGHCRGRPRFSFQSALSRPCVTGTCFTPRRSPRGRCLADCGVPPRAFFHCQFRLCSA